LYGQKVAIVTAVEPEKRARKPGISEGPELGTDSAVSIDVEEAGYATRKS